MVKVEIIFSSISRRLQFDVDFLRTRRSRLVVDNNSVDQCGGMSP